MQINTVRGPISPDDLGITITHEHILLDLDCYWSKPVEVSKQWLAYAPVELSIYGELNRFPTMNKDNLRLDDVEHQTWEIMEFRKAGGSTVVDVTNIGIGRDPQALLGISIATGLNIVMGSGFYIEASHPAYVAEKTIDELAEIVVTDVTEGVDGTGIRAGIIGEIGTSDPLTKNEEKVLRAAARAHLKTGVPINVHPWPWSDEGLKALDILESEGVDLHNVTMSHQEHNIAWSSGRAKETGELNLDVNRQVAERGAYVEYDTWGHEWYSEGFGNIKMPTDPQRAMGLAQLIKEGYLNQLLLAHDICLKTNTKKYGGMGYDHVLKRGVRHLKDAGVTEQQIRTMLVDNPKRALACKAP